MDPLYYVILAGVAVLLGYFIKHKQYQDVKDQKLILESQNTGLAEIKSQLESQLNEAHENILQLEKEISAFEIEKKVLDERIQNHKTDLADLRTQFKTEFENLGQKIFKDKSEESEKNLKEILAPFEKDLEKFKTKVETMYNEEGKERASLKTEIENIIKINERMQTETTNLTNALKGDSKTQGDWGEFILEDILQKCGLRKGEEYTVQGKDLTLKNEDGRHQKPDVIIHLPDQKHIIVDSKTSLTHYEQFWTGEDQPQKHENLKNFINSIYKHINDLNGKKYHQLDRLMTPEFVLMFIPMEPAYALAMQTDKTIFEVAWNKNIIIVGPGTLMPTLKTIAFLWKQERQNQNALDIARQGGALYDKFVGFLEDMDSIDQAIKKTVETFDLAKNKLQTGRGNLITRAEKLKELGARTAKQIPSHYLVLEEEEPEAPLHKLTS